MFYVHTVKAKLAHKAPENAHSLDIDYDMEPHSAHHCKTSDNPSATLLLHHPEKDAKN